ncbi:MAG TPA: glycosyltransferase family 2 protein [Candidatus Acidoferrum sp.]|nr:glycosyltransferase family 2 protein [Candidatus Acidoferrum sp.]
MQQHPEQTFALSCVVPAYNEAGNLERVLADIHGALSALTDRFEIILVNDGSRDDTARVARQLAAGCPQLVVIDLSRNFGKEAAISAGLDCALGDAVILMDGDGQHPVTLLPAMVEKWRSGLDIVYAVRKTRTDQSALYSLGTRIFYQLVNYNSRFHIPPDAGDFRLMDRKVVSALAHLPERNRFMKGLYSWVGYSSIGLEYEPLPRAEGKSHYGIAGGLRLALTGLLSFSTLPLKILSVAGALLSLVSMLYILEVLFEYFYWGIAVPGYATLIVSIMFFSGIQLLALGVMSAYIGHIYEEVKRRPVYLVRDKTGTGLGRQ